jgi:flagellar hook-length control protein FliK
MLLPPIPVPVRTAPEPRDSFKPDTASAPKSESARKTSSKSDDRDKDDKQKPVDSDQDFTQLLAGLINGATPPEPKPAAAEELAQTAATVATTDQTSAATSAQAGVATDAAKAVAIAQAGATTAANVSPTNAADATKQVDAATAAVQPAETTQAQAAEQQVIPLKQEATSQEVLPASGSSTEKPVQQKTEPPKVAPQPAQNTIAGQEEPAKGEQSPTTESGTTKNTSAEHHAAAPTTEKTPLQASEPPKAQPVQNASTLQDIGTGDVPKSEKSTGKRTAPMEVTPVNVLSADAAATAANPILVAAATTDAKAAVATTPGTSAPTAAHISAQVAQVLMGRDADIQAGQSKSFEMMLDPPELGRLFIQMSRGNRGLEVRISAEDDRVGALLQSSASDLQQSLQLSNLSLGQFGTNSQQTPNEAFRDLIDAGGSDIPVNTTGRGAAPAFVRPRAGASALNVVV